MCFLSGSMDKRSLIHFLKNLIDVNLLLNLHLSQLKLVFHFLVYKWAYLAGTFPLICTWRPQIDTSFTLHIISSCHTKGSIIYSQSLTISRIFSNKSDCLKHLESMKSWFEVKGYPNKLIEQEMKKVKFFRNGNVVRQRDPRKGVRFVPMYHPLFK